METGLLTRLHLYCRQISLGPIEAMLRNKVNNYSLICTILSFYQAVALGVVYGGACLFETHQVAVKMRTLAKFYPRVTQWGPSK